VAGDEGIASAPIFQPTVRTKTPSDELDSKMVKDETGALSDSMLGALTKEIEETKENLHVRFERLLAEELDERGKSFGPSRCSLDC